MTTATVRFWAAAREAAGMSEEPYPPGTLASIKEQAVVRHGARLGAVLDRSSFLVDGHPVGKRDHASVDVPAGAVREVLPPFAGG